MSISLPPFLTVVWGLVFLVFFLFFFLSILFCAGGNSQLDTEAVKLCWGGSSRHWDLAGTVLGWGRVSCPSPSVYPLETGTEGWFGGRPAAGAAPGFHWSWITLSAGLELSPFTPSDSSSPCFPLGVPSRHPDRPALPILNTRRCKSHLTFSF